jgi:hypothetical protein
MINQSKRTFGKGSAGNHELVYRREDVRRSTKQHPVLPREVGDQCFHLRNVICGCRTNMTWWSGGLIALALFAGRVYPTGIECMNRA